MTPVVATAPTPAPSAAGPRPERPTPGAGQSPFAQALERRQSASGTADAARGGRSGASPAPEAAATDPAEAGALLAADLRLPEGPDPASDTPVEVPPAVLPWPPVGLAGLLGLPPADPTTGPAPPPVEGDAAGEAASRLLPGLGPMPTAVPGAPPTAAAPVAAPPVVLPDLPIDEADAALPAAALVAEIPVSADDAAPAPVAFTLPATPALREPAPILAAPLPTPHVGAEDFEARFGAQLEWMADQKIGHARIRVTPHDLGPVEVRLHMDGDRIRAEFVSAQAETRQALEQGLPRLRDLLGESGFQLAHAGVGSGQAGRDGAPSSSPAQAGGEGPDGDVPSPAMAPARHRAVVGLLDAYA